MKHLHLDFVQKPRRFVLLRWLLLGLGLAVVVAVWLFYQIEIAPREEQLRQKLASVSTELRPVVKPSSMKPDELAATWKKAWDVADQLNLPWGKLFTAMGMAAGEDSLAFLSIDPDPQKGIVVVQAEARDFDDMLKFYRALQAREEFDDVSLQSHLINRAVPEHPVRFRLSARWKVRE